MHWYWWPAEKIFNALKRKNLFMQCSLSLYASNTVYVMVYLTNPMPLNWLLARVYTGLIKNPYVSRVLQKCVNLAVFLLMFVFLPFREYEDRELRIARERDRKRLEFTNQLQRINNQLEYEKSRDTQGMP